MAKANGKRRLSKREYQARVQTLRESLLRMQVGMKSVPFKVLLLLAGPEGAGRGNLLHALTGWLIRAAWRPSRLLPRPTTSGSTHTSGVSGAACHRFGRIRLWQCGHPGTRRH